MQAKKRCISKGGESLSLYESDPRHSCLAALLPAERRRLEDVLKEADPADVLDISQEPGKRARRTKHGENVFMTIIRQIGFCVRCDEFTRTGSTMAFSFICPVDMLSLSGFPITEAQEEAAGAPSIYSRRLDSSAPKRRTGGP